MSVDYEKQVTGEGYTPGTPRFDLRVQELRVLACQEAQGYAGCSECARFEFCDFAADFFVKTRYKGK